MRKLHLIAGRMPCRWPEHDTPHRGYVDPQKHELDEDIFSILVALPPSLHELDILKVRFRLLIQFLDRMLRENKEWLPNLRKLPGISVRNWILPEERRKYKESFLAGAKERGLVWSL